MGQEQVRVDCAHVRVFYCVFFASVCVLVGVLRLCAMCHLLVLTRAAARTSGSDDVSIDAANRWAKVAHMECEYISPASIVYRSSVFLRNNYIYRTKNYRRPDL